MTYTSENLKGHLNATRIINLLGKPTFLNNTSPLKMRYDSDFVPYLHIAITAEKAIVYTFLTGR